MTQLQAVIFGAIGVIAETSDLQRKAFNAAFREAGLDWEWDAKTYTQLLTINGGQARIRAFRDADPARSDVGHAMIAHLHDRKTQLYAGIVNDGHLKPRAGVVELMSACQDAGIRMAFCTSTSVENVDAMRAALGEHLDFSAFASITTIDKIKHVKPAPDAYLHCLNALSVKSDSVIAIEDSPVSMASAVAAGISVIATPGAMTQGQDFSAAVSIRPDLIGLSITELQMILDKVAAQE